MSESLSPTERYQDFVIKSGKLLAKFDEMYQRFDDPWRQSESLNNVLSASRNIALLNIARYEVHSVVEFGCGLGYYTDYLRRSLGLRVLGVDISPTAIDKARARFPESTFVVGNVRDVERYSEFDAVLFADITWYALNHLNQIFQRMLTSMRGKYFVHNLMFYKGSMQQYGREYFTSLDEFIEFCPFQLLARCEYTTADSTSAIETSSIFRIEPKH